MYKKDDIAGLNVLATAHAKERLEEFKIPFRKAVYLLKTGEEEHPDQKYKKKRYGDKQDGIRYVRNGRTLFTFKVEPHKRTGETVVILITVVDQAINLKKVPIDAEI